MFTQQNNFHFWIKYIQKTFDLGILNFWEVVKSSQLHAFLYRKKNAFVTFSNFHNFSLPKFSPIEHWRWEKISQAFQ